VVLKINKNIIQKNYLNIVYCQCNDDTENNLIQYILNTTKNFHVNVKLTVNIIKKTRIVFSTILYVRVIE